MTDIAELVQRSREAFAAYGGLGRKLIDEMIHALEAQANLITELVESRNSYRRTADELAKHIAELEEELEVFRSQDFHDAEEN